MAGLSLAVNSAEAEAHAAPPKVRRALAVRCCFPVCVRFFHFLRWTGLRKQEKQVKFLRKIKSFATKVSFMYPFN